MKEYIEYYFRQLKQQMNDSYKAGQLDTVTHNSMMLTLNSLERTIKTEKHIYPCEYISRNVANCKWRECVKLDCPKNKNNPDNR